MLIQSKYGIVFFNRIFKAESLFYSTKTQYPISGLNIYNLNISRLQFSADYKRIRSCYAK